MFPYLWELVVTLVGDAFAEEGAEPGFKLARPSVVSSEIFFWKRCRTSALRKHASAYSRFSLGFRLSNAFV